jgi:hypothetical protein
LAGSARAQGWANGRADFSRHLDSSFQPGPIFGLDEVSRRRPRRRARHAAPRFTAIHARCGVRSPASFPLTRLSCGFGFVRPAARRSGGLRQRRLDLVTQVETLVQQRPCALAPLPETLVSERQQLFRELHGTAWPDAEALARELFEPPQRLSSAARLERFCFGLGDGEQVAHSEVHVDQM